MEPFLEAGRVGRDARLPNAVYEEAEGNLSVDAFLAK